jgi:hypothetical protein
MVAAGKNKTTRERSSRAMASHSARPGFALAKKK